MWVNEMQRVVYICEPRNLHASEDSRKLQGALCWLTGLSATLKWLSCRYCQGYDTYHSLSLSALTVKWLAFLAACGPTCCCALLDLGCFSEKGIDERW
ncbi:hypothetical protein BaRGS_00018325 [Batillaria attramentaria]|uniref:Uncharacterized protein n=1 Tax=Batillaria attramentaria TaxID=370345 RepID=A0ABD0KSW4_9CAEN